MRLVYLRKIKKANMSGFERMRARMRYEVRERWRNDAGPLKGLEKDLYFYTE